MGKRTCRLCGRRFASGLALAGHMRSHATKPAQPLPPSPESYHSVDPELSPLHYAGSSTIVHDAESDTESSIAPPAPPQTVSAATIDVAHCLMMLSRDAWTRSEGDRVPAGRSQLQRQSGYQCGSCKKVFASHHALGGHRAGRKKLGLSCKMAGQADLVHECPICFRVFSSGQALGGHKRSHLYPAPVVAPVVSSPPHSPAESSISLAGAMLGESSMIDLNQPAMEEW